MESVPEDTSDFKRSENKLSNKQHCSKWNERVPSSSLHVLRTGPQDRQLGLWQKGLLNPGGRWDKHILRYEPWTFVHTYRQEFQEHASILIRHVFTDDVSCYNIIRSFLKQIFTSPIYCFRKLSKNSTTDWWAQTHCPTFSLPSSFV